MLEFFFFLYFFVFFSIVSNRACHKRNSRYQTARKKSQAEPTFAIFNRAKCSAREIRRINRGRPVCGTKSGEVEIRSNISRVRPALLSH